jgi:hypothetical protein
MSLKRDVQKLILDSISNLGLNRAYLRIRRARGENVDHLFRPTLAERFSAIYQNRVWLNDRPSGSLSGLGSEWANTDRVREQLQPLLTELNTQTLLDVGCGDFLWMKEINLDCQYIGVDIVRDVIEANASLYGSARRSFQVLDATCDPLPPADTVLCRDVIFHLSFRDIWRLVENVRDSGASFLIATTDNALRLNADIISGDFRQRNLRKAPFYFPTPVLSIPDNGVVPDRVLAAWGVSELPQKRSDTGGASFEHTPVKS